MQFIPQLRMYPSSIISKFGSIWTNRSRISNFQSPIGRPSFRNSLTNSFCSRAYSGPNPWILEVIFLWAQFHTVVYLGPLTPGQFGVFKPMNENCRKIGVWPRNTIHITLSLTLVDLVHHVGPWDSLVKSSTTIGPTSMKYVRTRF